MGLDDPRPKRSCSHIYALNRRRFDQRIFLFLGRFIPKMAPRLARSRYGSSRLGAWHASTERDEGLRTILAGVRKQSATWLLRPVDAVERPSLRAG